MIYKWKGHKSEDWKKLVKTVSIEEGWRVGGVPDWVSLTQSELDALPENKRAKMRLQRNLTRRSVLSSFKFIEVIGTKGCVGDSALAQRRFDEKDVTYNKEEAEVVSTNGAPVLGFTIRRFLQVGIDKNHICIGSHP